MDSSFGIVVVFLKIVRLLIDWVDPCSLWKIFLHLHHLLILMVSHLHIRCFRKVCPCVLHGHLLGWGVRCLHFDVFLELFALVYEFKFFLKLLVLERKFVHYDLVVEGVIALVTTDKLFKHLIPVHDADPAITIVLLLIVIVLLISIDSSQCCIETIRGCWICRPHSHMLLLLCGYKTYSRSRYLRIDILLKVVIFLNVFRCCSILLISLILLELS